MNWSKGKNRLIILFLSINILLGWANYRKGSGAHVLKETQVQDIKKVLEENNIFVDSPIPREYMPLQKLTVFPYQIDSKTREVFVNKLLQTLDGVKVSIEAPKVSDEKPRRIYRKDEEIVIFEGENILYRHEGIIEDDAVEVRENMDINGAKKIAEKWLTQMEYSPRKMHMQVVEQPGDLHIIYYDKYEGMPVFDSYVKIQITPLGISQVEIHKVELGGVTGEKQDIYSVDQVFFYLIKIISKEEPIHIKDIVVGYALENPKGTHLIAEKAIPFYQVILEDGRIYYINAYNSEIREQPHI